MEIQPAQALQAAVDAQVTTQMLSETPLGKEEQVDCVRKKWYLGAAEIGRTPISLDKARMCWIWLERGSNGREQNASSYYSSGEENYFNQIGPLAL